MSGKDGRRDKKEFEKYAALLEKWQGAVNLIGSKTREEIWTRHIEDSLSLLDFINGADRAGGGRIFDIGSGGGFPGMVLAIAGVRGMTLVESDTRKCAFLEEAKRTYGLDVEITNQRVESMRVEGGAGRIVGRAFAPLERFFNLCDGLIGEKTVMYLLKGERVGEEIETAKKNWDFEYTLYDKTGGHILEARNIKRK
ncbi:MAG: 16S rRNA (guanine(527)-N(7))-methyltransferase RsmG [Rickettsiales bacterium]|jgi:16S rRNA (guanine527-N7)-methyltransferase|nr:16S rRNA (guanine(527)-N(7))-methyltransferase RsmG [Rickettsiales bacterium]